MAKCTCDKAGYCRKHLTYRAVGIDVEGVPCRCGTGSYCHRHMRYSTPLTRFQSVESKHGEDRDGCIRVLVTEGSAMRRTFSQGGQLSVRW